MNSDKVNGNVAASPLDNQNHQAKVQVKQKFRHASFGIKITICVPYNPAIYNTLTETPFHIWTIRCCVFGSYAYPKHSA